MRDGGKIAIVSDEALDDLFLFMLPENIKLVSLAREREPEYGRELGEWVRQEVKVKGEGEQRKIEDLAFAAELGPGGLVDEWVKIDKQGFEAKVATVASYFGKYGS